MVVESCARTDGRATSEAELYQEPPRTIHSTLPTGRLLGAHPGRDPARRTSRASPSPRPPSPRRPRPTTCLPAVTMGEDITGRPRSLPPTLLVAKFLAGGSPGQVSPRHSLRARGPGRTRRPLPAPGARLRAGLGEDPREGRAGTGGPRERGAGPGVRATHPGD